MNDISRLLSIAIEDNIAWCSRMCFAHGSNETTSSNTWANLALSPPFYPNIITRERNAQPAVEELGRKVREVNESGNWGIKDSFADLALMGKGFERILLGHWYGGMIGSGNPAGWNTVTCAAELHAWEEAWGQAESRVFPENLLDDTRITFWFKGSNGTITSGFISFDTGFSLGLSNWFSLDDESFSQMGIVQAAGSISHGLPVVCWATDDLTQQEGDLIELGRLQIWLAR